MAVKDRIWIVGFAPLIVLCLGLWAIAGDGTANKEANEVFEMYADDGTLRTNCDLDLFAVTFFKDGVRVALSGTFRNTTGAYVLSYTPTSSGYYHGYIDYSSVQTLSFSREVRAYDVDTQYTALSERMDNMSSTILTRAPAASALSTATWTTAKAVTLGNLSTTIKRAEEDLAARFVNISGEINGIDDNPWDATAWLNYTSFQHDRMEDVYANTTGIKDKTDKQPNYYAP